MKANILKTLMAVVALVIGATSCDDKGYWDAYQPEGDQYSFIAADYSTEFPLNLPAEERTLNVPIRRADATAEATLPLKLSAANSGSYDVNEMFIVPTEITFAAGEYQVEIPILFKGTRRNYAYACVLSFDENVTSPGGFNETKISCKMVNPK